MKLIRTGTCNFYLSEENEAWMTRRQIGEALGYANPRDTIKNKHKQHRARMNKSSKKVELIEGSPQKTVMYSEKGIYDLILLSDRPETDQLRDFMYAITAALRKIKEEVGVAKRVEMEDKESKKRNLMKLMNNVILDTNFSLEKELVALKTIRFLASDRF